MCDLTFHEQNTPRIDIRKTVIPSTLLYSFYYHENLIFITWVIPFCVIQPNISLQPFDLMYSKHFTC